MRSVLLIEDNDAERVGDMLVDAGYVVDIADCGATGLPAYGHHRRDLVVTDHARGAHGGVKLRTGVLVSATRSRPSGR
jgi:CheY-like chemotaxis protein